MDRSNIDIVSLMWRYYQIDYQTEGDSPSNRAPNQGELCKTLEENVLKMPEQWT